MVTADRRPPIRRPQGDAGSVLPLVIGMVACLLLLGAGVTAATSAFIARGNLQHLCDGAASAAADAAQRAALTTATDALDEVAFTAAGDYLAPRAVSTEITVTVGGAAVQLQCTRTAAITFGALFAVSTMTQTVRSTGRTVLAADGT